MFFLWISRDYLWINGSSCGEVAQLGENPGNSAPHIWAAAWWYSKIWI